MAVPYTFQTATGSIPLSQLDSNFATGITIGNTSVLLGDSISTINNLSLANVAITSVSTSFPNGYLANSNVIVGTTTLTLGSTVTTIDGLTLGNVTIASGNVTISNVTTTNVSATTANVSGTANISNLVVIGNETVGGNTTVTGNITAAKGTFTSANVSGTANVQVIAVTQNATVAGNATVTGNVSAANGTFTSANVSGTANVSTLAVIGNGTVGGNVTVTGNVSMNVATITTANVSNTANVSTLVVTANQTSLGNITATGNVTAAKLIPTGSSVTGNGLYLPAANALGLSTNGTNAVYIDASQNVGIGTASPGYKLTINTSAGTASFYTTDAATSDFMVTPGVASGVVRVGPVSGAMAFYSANSERMRIDSSGNLLVGLTSATSGGGVLQVSNGITFPATQSASSNVNTLDDYEEGTWTPSIGGTATYGTVIGTYTKIGDTVRIYFDISISVIGTGSTTTVSGVPFSCTYNDAGAISYYSTLNVNAYFVQAQMSGATMTFPGTTAAQATITNTMAIFKSGTRILGTVVYKTST